MKSPKIESMFRILLVSRNIHSCLINKCSLEKILNKNWKFWRIETRLFWEKMPEQILRVIR